MSPQRVVLLFSVVIASVIFAVIAYLFSGGRTYMYVLDTRQIVSVGAAVRVDAVFATVASPSAPPGLTRKSEDVLRHGERRISPETLSSSIDTPASLAARSQEHSEPGVLNATEESLHIQNVNAVLVATFSSPDSLDAKYLQQDSESLDASNHPEEVKYPSVDMRNTQYHSHSHSETDTSHHPVALHQHSSPNDVGMGVSHSASAPTFTVQNNFNFPHPRNYLPAQEILEADWVKQLKRYLLNIHPAHSLTLTVATKSFIPNLLNWLIAAHLLVDPPLQHILVVAFDKEVHTLMAGRKLASIHVPVSSVTKGIRREILRLWMTRLAVIRLLNHWGYDVQQFDNDAVLLRNPQPLFDAYSDYDLFGARGSLPFHLGKGPWEFALCMGAAWLRGTEKMESLWDVMHSHMVEKTTDDQKRINFALVKTNMHWQSKELHDDRANVGSNQYGLKVAVLPPKYICRKTCILNRTTELFIWHQNGGGHNASWKSENNSKSHVWFLRSDFMTRVASPDITGLQWLQWITQPGSIESIRQRLSHVVPMI